MFGGEVEESVWRVGRVVLALRAARLLAQDSRSVVRPLVRVSSLVRSHLLQQETCPLHLRQLPQHRSLQLRLPHHWSEYIHLLYSFFTKPILLYTKNRFLSLSVIDWRLKYFFLLFFIYMFLENSNASSIQSQVICDIITNVHIGL